MENSTIYLVSSSIYELAWISKLPLEAMTQLHFLEVDASSTEPSLLASVELLLDNLLLQQYADGSWGSAAISPGDRMITTLAALTALAFNQRRWEQLGVATAFPPNFQKSMQAGLDWLINSHQLEHYDPRDDLADLAGLELLVPALLEELESLGVTKLRSLVLGAVLQKGRTKLNMVPPKLIFQSGSTLSHALEFTGQLLTPTLEQVGGAVSPNGSVGNSPSATAFALCYAWNSLEEVTRRRMLAYLRQSANATFFWKHSERSSKLFSELNGFAGLGWPVTYPVNHFLEIWYRYYLVRLKLDSNPSATNLNQLAEASLESSHNRAMPTKRRTGTTKLLSEKTNHSSKGFGADEHFAVDADTTATYICVMAHELVQTGNLTKLRDLMKVLIGFFEPQRGHFITYPFEMTGSLTTNVHAWQALDVTISLSNQLQLNPPELAQLVELRTTTAQFIKSQAKQQTYWQDKWHMSPVYATCHAVISGMFNQDKEAFMWINRILNWLLENQFEVDGGWGFVPLQPHQNGQLNSLIPASNVDETLHALVLLLYIKQNWHELFRSSGRGTGALGELRSKVDTALQRGVTALDNLVENHPPYTWAALWCDKTLYCPYGVLYELSKKLLQQVSLPLAA